VLHKTARPPNAGGVERPGLDDLRVAAESEASLFQNALRAQATRRLRRQRLVERIHALGARAVFELVDELDRHHALGDDLDRRLQRYADADPELLRALGVHRFAPSPMRIVGGRP
jgi:hypothetical protein